MRMKKKKLKKNSNNQIHTLTFAHKHKKKNIYEHVNHAYEIANAMNAKFLRLRIPGKLWMQ